MRGVGGLEAERSAAVAARASAVAGVPGAGCRVRGRVRMGAACSGAAARTKSCGARRRKLRAGTARGGARWCAWRGGAR